MRTCVAAGCPVRYEAGVTMHAFPADQSVRAAWIAFVRMKRKEWKYTPGSLLCSNHFAENCYDMRGKFDFGLDFYPRKRLIAKSVPTVYKTVDNDKCRPKPNSRKRSSYPEWFYDKLKSDAAHKKEEMMSNVSGGSATTVQSWQQDSPNLDGVSGSQKKRKISSAEENSQSSCEIQTEVKSEPFISRTCTSDRDMSQVKLESVPSSSDGSSVSQTDKEHILASASSFPSGLTQGSILVPSQGPSSGFVHITAPSNMMSSSHMLSPMELIPSNIPPNIVLGNLPNGYSITPTCQTMITNAMSSNAQPPMNAILANGPVPLNAVSPNAQLPLNVASSMPSTGNVISSNMPSTGNVLSSNMLSTGNVISSNMPSTGNVISSNMPSTGNVISSDMPSTGNVISSNMPSTVEMSSTMPFQEEVTPAVKTVYVYIPRPTPDVSDASTQTMESDFHMKPKEKLDLANISVKRENQDDVEDLFSPESVGKSNIKDLFKYYTGFSFLTFTALFNVFFPNSEENPVKYTMACEETEHMPLYNQLFLVLCRLRQGFGLKDLAFRFNIQPQTACVIFDSVVHYMYLRMKDIPLWPQRPAILQSVPQTSQPVMSIFGYTELKTLKPSDEDIQADICPDYKPNSTLQGLLAVSPNGDVSFVSVLFSAKLPEKDICKLSGFLGVLYEQKLNGHLEEGDSIIGTKFLKMKKDFSNIGLTLKYPSNISEDGSDGKSLHTSEVVEQRIEKILEFKLIGGGIPASLFSTINEVWFVCAVLTNFQTTPLPSQNVSGGSATTVQSWQQDSPNLDGVSGSQKKRKISSAEENSQSSCEIQTEVKSEPFISRTCTSDRDMSQVKLESVPSSSDGSSVSQTDKEHILASASSFPSGLTQGSILVPSQGPSSGFVHITAPSNMMSSSHMLSPMELIPSNIPPNIVLGNLPNGYSITPTCQTMITNAMSSNAQPPMNAILANGPVPLNAVSPNAQLPLNVASSMPSTGNVISSNMPSTGNVLSSNMLSTGNVISSNMPSTGNVISSNMPSTGNVISSDMPSTGNVISSNMPSTVEMSSTMPFQEEVTPAVKTVYVYIPRPTPDVSDASTQTMESDFHMKPKEKLDLANISVKRENQDDVEDLFSPESVGKSNIKDLFKYYTGFSFLTFTALFNVFFPNSEENPVKYTMACEETEHMPLYNQLFLVLCRLRQGFGLKDLAFRFNIQPQTACVIFDSVVHYMYLRMKDIPLWPQRPAILQSVPQTSQPVMSIFGYTELKTLKPSDEDIQADICPDYKPNSTLQGLLAVSPNGDVSFVSVLFSAKLPEKDICKLSGFLGVLYEQKLNGHLEEGDSIIGTKFLKMKKDFSNIGLTLKYPSNISEDGSDGKSLHTSEVVEQRIEKILEFKLIGGGIPASLFSTINEVWFVCAVLTNFQTTPLPSQVSSSRDNIV